MGSVKVMRLYPGATRNSFCSERGGEEGRGGGGSICTCALPCGSELSDYAAACTLELGKLRVC